MVCSLAWCVAFKWFLMKEPKWIFLQKQVQAMIFHGISPIYLFFKYHM